MVGDVPSESVSSLLPTPLHQTPSVCTPLPYWSADKAHDYNRWQVCRWTYLFCHRHPWTYRKYTGQIKERLEVRVRLRLRVKVSHHAFKNSVFSARTPCAVPSKMCTSSLNRNVSPLYSPKISFCVIAFVHSSHIQTWKWGKNKNKTKEHKRHCLNNWAISFCLCLPYHVSNLLPKIPRIAPLWTKVVCTFVQRGSPNLTHPNTTKTLTTTPKR